MTRRIVLAVVALVVAVLGVVAVPLGVLTSHQDMRDFQDEAVAATATLANVAEERLDDGVKASALDRAVRQLASDGDQVSVLDRHGRHVAGTAARPDVSNPQLTRATRTGSVAVYPSGDFLVVVAPVLRDSGAGSVGIVVLARPTSAVDRQTATLWAVIAAIAAAGLLAAALVAAGLARWVSRPLRNLELSAQEFGDGELGTRSDDQRGPGEVRQLAANFNVMAARLEALVRGNQATMADVSHQLRTPLSALRLRLDLLAQDSDEEATTELAGAQEEIARLSRLVNGLLAVARAEQVATPQVSLQLDEVITARIAAWRPAAEEREIGLQAELAPIVVRMSEGHLEQILDNLIANALDALPALGSVWISTTAVAERVRIAVADDGPGMSEHQQKRAFRRFATSNGGGTGLGLAIVDRLAVASGGSAALSDTDGGGLTVTIDLPQARSERHQRRMHSPGSPGQGGRGRLDTGSSQRWQRRIARSADENHPPG